MITPPVRPSATQAASHYDDLDPFYRKLWGDHVRHGLRVYGLFDAAKRIEPAR